MSNGNWVMSIEHELRNSAGGIHSTVPCSTQHCAVTEQHRAVALHHRHRVTVVLQSHVCAAAAHDISRARHISSVHNSHHKYQPSLINTSEGIVL